MTILTIDEVLIRSPELLEEYRKPLGNVKLDLNHPAVGRKSIYYPFTPKTGYLDIVNGELATVTGSVPINSFGAQFDGGTSYLTTSASRHRYLAHEFLALVQFRWGADLATGTYTLISGASTDKFFQFVLSVDTTVPNYNIAFNLYINNAMRTINTAFTGTQKANDIVTVCGWFNRPYLRTAMRINSGRVYTDISAALNASVDDEGGGLYFGRNNAGTDGFTGSIAFLYISEKAIPVPLGSSLVRDPYQILVPA